MEKDSSILITGARGMVGKSLTNKLSLEGFDNILNPTSAELDLQNQGKVLDYFRKKKIDYVFHLAAKVGGISANMTSPASFLYQNLMIGSNVIDAAKKHKVKKLLFLGSSCIYPKDSKQPIKEDYLLSGKLEPTNEGYALAKIAGLKLCEYYNKQYGTNFISLMPCNLYGPHDHFGEEGAHVIPSLISRFHEAKLNNSPSVIIWGTGKPKREFLFSDDLSDAMLFFMKNYEATQKNSFINIGAGSDVSIKDLAYLIKETTEYRGDIIFDTGKPDGMMRKLLDVSVAQTYGWSAKTPFKKGLQKTYDWYKESISS